VFTCAYCHFSESNKFGYYSGKMRKSCKIRGRVGVRVYQLTVQRDKLGV
jgi:hypothetical protein